MKHGRVLLLLLPAVAISILASRRSPAPATPEHVVRLAQLEIDPTQLDAYKAALREEIDASLRLEPGVLTLYAVSIKEHPEQVRLFEIYRDAAAYHSHLQTPHFLSYKSATAGMVKSLTLLETEPIRLGAKPLPK